jgi:hypothetical protein
VLPTTRKPAVRAFAVAAFTAALCGQAAASWDGDGIRVSPIPASQVGQMITSDGLDGWFVSWSDYSTYDVFLQHLDGQGSVVAGWPAEGLTVCDAPGDQGAALLLPDGQGGVFLLWADTRDGAVSGYDAYLQRITADGLISPGWPVNGLAVCTAPGNQLQEHMVLDGAGGLVVLWTDDRDAATSSRDVYARRILVNGSFDPAWPSNGRLLNVMAGDQAATRTGSDGVRRYDCVLGELCQCHVCFLCTRPQC